MDASAVSLARENKIPIVEKNISVSEFYNADQVFTTGTMGELAQVVEIDKRKINNNFSTFIYFFL